MLKVKSVVIFLVLMLALIPVTSAFAADEPKDILDTAAAAGQFQTLSAAVAKADLVSALKGEGPYTVFAPTDEAFAALLNKLGVTADQLLARPDLKDILLYHVVQGKVKSTDLKDGMKVKTLGGQELTVSLNPIQVNDANVVKADIEASNGIIHVIDAVLLPESKEKRLSTEPLKKDIVDTALAAGSFHTLAQALQKENLVSALKGEGPYTVFAPTDAAFAALLDKLGVTADQLLARPDLKDILLYHVVQGKVKSSDLKDGMKVKTLGGQELTVSLNPVQVNDANVVKADIEASNGYIHVIDAVLLPLKSDSKVTNPKTGSQSMAPYVWMSALSAAGLLVLFTFNRKKSADN